MQPRKHFETASSLSLSQVDLKRHVDEVADQVEQALRVTSRDALCGPGADVETGVRLLERALTLSSKHKQTTSTASSGKFCGWAATVSTERN